VPNPRPRLVSSKTRLDATRRFAFASPFRDVLAHTPARDTRVEDASKVAADAAARPLGVEFPDTIANPENVARASVPRPPSIDPFLRRV
jgi:hypothetical protein